MREKIINKIIFTNVPMPPTSNSQYAAMAVRGSEGRYFGKIRPTRELEDYQKEFDKWKIQYGQAVISGRQFIRNKMLDGLMLKIEVYLCFSHSEMWTVKGAVKKMDGSNRIKALHDLMADALNIDDSYFWESSVEKVESIKEKSWCIVAISAVKPRGVGELKW